MSDPSRQTDVTAENRVTSGTSSVRKVRAVAYRGSRFDRQRVSVVRETPLTLFLNEREIVTLLCMDDAPRYLALGFFFSEGLIRDVENVRDIEVDRDQGCVRVRVSEDTGTPVWGRELKPTLSTGCGKGTTFRSGLEGIRVSEPGSDCLLSAEQVFYLMKELTARSDLYKETRGTHNCALAEGYALRIFHSDVGRHNAVDKIYGQCLLEGIGFSDKMLLTTGRITSEIVMKVGRMGIPVLISRHAATDLAIRIGSQLGKTLVGYVRGTRFTVYTGFSRFEEWADQGA